MSVLTDCSCEFCVGWDGRHLVSVSYEIAEASGLVAAAKKSRVTIKQSDQIFVVEGLRAIACVRFIRRKLSRLCGCWVAPEIRGQGWGEMLVRHRIAYLERHTSVKAIDTFAFRKQLFVRMGFEPRAGYKIGTTLLRKVIDR